MVLSFFFFLVHVLISLSFKLQEDILTPNLVAIISFNRVVFPGLLTTTG